MLGAVYVVCIRKCADVTVNRVQEDVERNRVETKLNFTKVVCARARCRERGRRWLTVGDRKRTLFTSNFIAAKCNVLVSFAKERSFNTRPLRFKNGLALGALRVLVLVRFAYTIGKCMRRKIDH